jgi:hypothetical protein
LKAFVLVGFPGGPFRTLLLRDHRRTLENQRALVNERRCCFALFIRVALHGKCGRSL